MDSSKKSIGQSNSRTSSSSSKSTTGEAAKVKSKSTDRKRDGKSQKDAKASDSKYSSENLRQKLREHFQHKDFKSTLQKEAIKEIMRGNIEEQW